MPVEIERAAARVEADVARDPLGVVRREVAVDLRDLLEQFEVGRAAGRSAPSMKSMFFT